MRSGMKKKPLDFPREYFEVQCTTAEKKYFEYMACRYNHWSLGDFVRKRMIGNIYPADSHFSEKEKIKYWEDKLAEEKARQAELMKAHKSIKPKPSICVIQVDQKTGKRKNITKEYNKQFLKKAKTKGIDTF